jgi:hypothetical protein
VVWDCKACHKRSYPTRSRAYEAIENHHTYNAYDGRPLPARAYECPYNNGWHLTSQPERSSA